MPTGENTNCRVIQPTDNCVLITPDEIIIVTIPPWSRDNTIQATVGEAGECPPLARLPAGGTLGRTFAITFYDATGQNIIHRFQPPLDITVKYTQQDLDAVEGDASRLFLARCNETTAAWEFLQTTRDLFNSTLSVSSMNFSDWGIVRTGLSGAVATATPTPEPTPTATPTPEATPTATAVPPPTGDISPTSTGLITLMLLGLLAAASGLFLWRRRPA